MAIATPVGTHFELAKRALESGRHVWLEKPMTETVAQAEALIELAQKKQKVLLVDHTFVYTGAVRKIKELIDQGELGELIYYDSTRVNLGLFQQDVNVIWDLAPHDISIMDFLMPFKKLAVSATGSHYYGNGLVPKSVLTVYMAGKGRPHQRELGIAGQDPPDPDRRHLHAWCSTTTPNRARRSRSTTRAWT